MAELKRNFSQAKMNKDMDERVLGPGQYRDANNVEISNSEGSNVGTVQTLLGNTERTNGLVPSDFSTCVGTYAVPEKDKIYYFVSSEGDPANNYIPNISKDYIIEYDTKTQATKYVFVDIFQVKETITVANSTAGANYFEISDNGDGVLNTTGVRTGMMIVGDFTGNGGPNINATNQVIVKDVVHSGSGTWKIYHDYQWWVGATNIPVAVNDTVTFVPNKGVTKGRVLQFNCKVKINAISHVEDMLFWTDGYTEPKKINITKSIHGTGGLSISPGWTSTQLTSHASNQGITQATAQNTAGNINNNNAHFHTRLVLKHPNLANMYVLATNRAQITRIDTIREHVTVIKKSPKFPLQLHLSKTSADRTPDSTPGNLNPTPNIVSSAIGASGGGVLQTMNFVDGNGDPLSPGSSLTIHTFDPVDFRVGDELILTADSSAISGDTWSEDLMEVTVKVDNSAAGKNNPITGAFSVSIVSIASNIATSNQQFFIRLKDKEPLFKFKFPRFSYRYKFDDGEYSTFAPWTSVAFLPGDYDYTPKEGYNTGMVNTLRSIKLTDYFHESDLVPRDVVGIDLLYKEDGKPTVYTVKTLLEKDGSPEWPDRKASNRNRGSFILTTEMIHAVVPSNQILRPWDNVPKSAKAQEITSNRLLYGNYKQGYNITSKVKLDVLSVSRYNQVPEPYPSLKSMRTYQLGVVYSDEYGRETPVLVPKKASSISLEKKYSTYQNKLKVKLDYSSDALPPNWAKYLRYYIKETSNEYYNLTQDRWYDAEDGNVWLSFPSAERNKVDEETFLILKNEHDDDKPVFDDIRYKVVAISEDAPLFVKTTQKILGNFPIWKQATGTTAWNGPDLAAVKQVYASPTDMKDALGQNFFTEVLPRIPAGMIYARVVVVSTNVLTSRWVGLTKFVDTSSNNFIVNLDEVWGDSVDFSYLTNPAYSLEIRQDTVAHKPEFDGRFFVKVLRDAALKKHILKIDESDPNFIVVNNHSIASIIAPGKYAPTINSSGQWAEGAHPSLPGSGGAFNNGNYNWSASGGFDSGDKFGYCGGLGETRDFWQSTTSSKFFIDGAKFEEDDINYQTGTSSWPHKSGGGDHNGLHTSHPGGNRSSSRGLKMLNNGKAQIWFGARGWYNDHSTDMKKFYSDMRKIGGIFRFRSDPAKVPYRITARKGRAQVGNFVRNTTWCNRCKSKENGCKRHIFSIEFERLDGTTPGANNTTIDYTVFDPISALKHDGTSFTGIDILEVDIATSGGGASLSTDDPAIWETEPKEDVGLDIYYEASGSLPLDVDHTNNELLIPLYSTIMVRGDVTFVDASGVTQTLTNVEHGPYKIFSVSSTGNADTTFITISQTNGTIAHDSFVTITRYDGSEINLYVGKPGGGSYAATNTGTASNPSGPLATIELMTGKSPTNLTGGWQPWRAPHFQPILLPWNNCWRFGNGVESDRIRDDYNATRLDNGVKASTVLATPYAEEHKSSGLIFSGIFNSTSGINNLNQFIQAEPITKDLNPRHGSIQALVTRDTDTTVFCEDKVLKILTNKDALFNADGSANVTSNAAVLGQAVAIQGDYGISKYPDSLAVTSTSMYWCDVTRGQVLHLSGSAITPISEIGMKDFFNDNLKDVSHAEGTFDDKKDEYNLTLKTVVYKTQYRPDFKLTASYSERVKGWTSFKSFDPETAISLNNEYYSFKKGSMWQHHTNTTRNNFYGVQYTSDITTIFNDSPGSVKSFNTLNYEGTQARITPFLQSSPVNAAGVTLSNINDNDYKNLTADAGWYVDNIKTNLQETENIEFRDKEGKWFGTIKGAATTLSNLDGREISVQGLGASTATSNTGTPSAPYKLTAKPWNHNAANNINWDSTADATSWRIVYPTVFPEFVQGTTVPDGEQVFTITNVVNNGFGVLQYSGFDMSAEDFEVPTLNNNVTTSGTGWNTVYIHTAHTGATASPPVSWNADTVFSGNTIVSGIQKVEFRNLGQQGPSNQVEVKVYYKGLTMPASPVNYFVDVDVKSSVILPPVNGNVSRNSSFVVSVPD